MATAAVIFGISYLLIAIGRIPHVLVAVLGAMAMVFFGALTGHEALSHVNLEVIMLLAGMMSLANMIAKTGAFDWAAIKSAQLVKGNGFLTLCLMCLLTAVASAFLDNVTVVVLAVPITLSICRTLELNPVPFLLAQVFASNIGGVSTIVADPPNIIIASEADIGFVDFMLNAAPVSLVSMFVLFALLYLWFRNGVTTTAESRESIMRQDANSAITDKGLLIKCSIVFGFTVLGFLTHELLHVGPAYIALTAAAVLTLVARLDPQDVLEQVEWTTLAFFIGLFMLVGGLEDTGWTVEIREWLVDLSGGNERDLAFLLVWFGGMASAIVDNIPFTATMVEVVGGFSEDGSEGISPLWWALAMGADLGGNATIVGASANVIVVNLARAGGYPISFFQFLRYGAVISVLTLMVSTAYLWIRYYS